MNTKLNFSKGDIKYRLQSLRPSPSEERLIERDSAILQANYLSEIERLYQNKGLNRKELAYKIGTSPSYLTQVFRGDKPLNFLTLAKIKRALNLRFEVTASVVSEKKTDVAENIISTSTIDRKVPVKTITSTEGDGFSQVYNVAKSVEKDESYLQTA